MKILITTVQAPFVSGGAEFHAMNLKNALLSRGHEAEIVTIPFMDSPVHLITDHIVASRLFDLENTWAGKVDLCIGLKFPAYFIPHPNKVVWALHQHRAAYELFNTQYSNLKDDYDGRAVRDAVHRADCRYLAEAKRIYANSANVARRMMKYNQLRATPLYHPCPDMDKFYVGESDNYILMPSRINITKRQILAVEAMKYVKSDIKLYIVGKADHVSERERMLKMIRENHLEDKVKYLDYVEQEEKYKLYANARAVLFIPLDEDYGYITLEAMSSGKAVITCEDSGGPLEFVEDGSTGYVVQAEARAVAEKIDKMGHDPKLSAELGSAAHRKLKQMNISWDNVVKELIRP